MRLGKILSVVNYKDEVGLIALRISSCNKRLVAMSMINFAHSCFGIRFFFALEGKWRSNNVMSVGLR